MADPSRNRVFSGPAKARWVNSPRWQASTSTE